MKNTYPATIDQLYNMLKFVKDESLTAGFSASIVTKIEMAAEEALVNIITYGYPNSAGSIEIQCLSLSQKGIKIVIKDQGIDFNPLEIKNDYNPKEPFKDRIGGYGIFFIKQLFDGIDYAREDESNILTLVKYHN